MIWTVDGSFIDISGILHEAVNMTAVKNMVEFVSKSLASSPEDVSVHERIKDRSIQLQLEVAQQDMGRIIGRKGRMINAMRALGRVLGKKMHRRVHLHLVE